MSTQFSAHMISLLDDVTLLNRAIYGGPDALKTEFLDDYDADRDPNDVGNRDALFVYDRYDLYLKKFGFQTLSAAELGFQDTDTKAADDSDGQDHNYTYIGDLYRNNYIPDGEGGETAFTAAGAVALVSLKQTDAGNTLNLTFRGTDADGPLADGEAGTAEGQLRYYNQLKTLIDKVYAYVSDPSHNVSEVVVSGHSLGGAVADMFALYDGARFADIDGVKLSVVALASAGIDPGLLDIKPGYDPTIVSTGEDGVTFNTPDWYFQYDNTRDIVRNPGQYDFVKHTAEDPTQAPVTAFAVSLLGDHIHFGDNRLQIETPKIDQYVVSKDLATNFLVNHYADFYEMTGTELSKAWPLAGDMTFDRFIALFGVNEKLDGTPGANNVNGFGVPVDDSVNYGSRHGNLFVLGLSGDDTIRSGTGSDFLAGGSGDDRILGQDGDDTLLGDVGRKTGNDVLVGGEGADTFYGGHGNDRLVGGAGNDMFSGGFGKDRLVGGAGVDTFIFANKRDADTIADFAATGKNHDVIDINVKGITDWADLTDHHMKEVHDSVVIEGAHGETMTLRHMQLADLQESDFVF